MDTIHDVVIVGGNRLPFALPGGSYAQASSHDMLLATLEGLVDRFDLAGQQVGEVCAGAIILKSTDVSLVRQVVLSSSLAPTTPALGLRQAGATGLTTAIAVANKIALGQIDSGIAGGADTASAMLDGGDARLHRPLTDSRATTMPRKPAVLARLRRVGHTTGHAADSHLLDEQLTGMSMGEHQAITTARWGITRQAQDARALASHQGLTHAWDSGLLDDLSTEFMGLTRDEPLRPDVTMGRLAQAPIAYGTTLPNPTMTGANAAPLADGASLTLLSNRQWASDRGLPMLARLVDSHTSAVDYVHGYDGMLHGGTYAGAHLLARHGLTLDDIDVHSIHEPFAATLLTTLAAWADVDYCRDVLGLDAPLGSVDPAKVNQFGSALAAGHPPAATGGRVLAITAKMVAHHAANNPHLGRPSRALVVLFGAGGIGVAALLESLP
ncbi:MAG: acetyl-CoA C-acyltransferase [Cellulomonadaceae bacterium]|nr:acetyl-CoA C-acyltransferase [Cellulomonadaceae bacterium]